MNDYIVEISESPRHVSVERGLLKVQEKTKKLGEIPLDCITALILSGEGCTISRHALARLAEQNIPVVVCDAKYMPISIATPVSSHFRQLSVATLQINASPVLKKQLWRHIVSAKITNQAENLRRCHVGKKAEYDKLCSLAGTVFSGDSDNKEGQAARLYWSALMGSNFLRDTDAADANIFLNYGYTVLRAICARSLCAAGLLSLFGLHHCNTYNAFCLADDIMEPYRPFVDSIVFGLYAKNAELELNPASKKALTALLQTPVLLAKEEFALVNACTRTAQSLVRSLEENSVKILCPQFLPLKQK